LTDQPFFGGDLNDLLEARTFSPIPLLRKDFIIDTWQIAEAKAFGADVILLIAACLTPDQVRQFARYAVSLGLEVLLELHAPEELGHICEETNIIGINNRDLRTFRVDVEQSLRMAASIGKDKLLVAESGISDPKEVLRFRKHGFSGFLMGEHFMKEPDPGAAFARFAGSLKTTDE
jgi:indole-3-glycerol phosphate synthase